MQTRPSVDWRLAGRLAGTLLGDLPEVTRPEAHQAVASLHELAGRAGDLAKRFSHLDGEPAATVLVTDRQGWLDGVSHLGAAMLATVDLPERTGWGRRASALGHGAAAGVGLGLVGRGLLGQFDPFSEQRPLYLIAPNIVDLERRRRFVPRDFRLWVAIHEQTHALQFSAAPWLLDHLSERLRLIARDEVGSADMVRNLAAGRGLSALFASQDGHRALDEVTAAMTLLEGHADYVADTAGRIHVKSVKRLRRAFSRDGSPSRVAKLWPAIDKDAQYRDGLAFCRAVARRVGRRKLARAFESPETLPTLPEIAQPREYLRRVHGTA